LRLRSCQSIIVSPGIYPDYIMEVILMNEKTLTDLIAKTKEAIKPFQHSESTLWQYDYGWRDLCNFYAKHKASFYSDELLSQYVTEVRQRYETGAIAAWKFKLLRKTEVIQA
jgi:hypothetical protein